MASATTVYDFVLNFKVTDSGTSKLDDIAKHAEKAESRMSSLTKAGLAFATGFLLHEGWHKGKEMFIGLNSEMEQLKISMGGIVSYNLGMPFKEASIQTDKLVEGWQQFSKSTTLTTSEIADFGQRITAAVMGSGGGIEMLDEMTRKGAVLAKVLAGSHPGGMQYASLEISEALMGNFRRTQMFNAQLLGPLMKKMGMEMHDWNKLAADKRMEIMLQAMNDPAWQAVIEKQKNSWEGVTSTFKDNMEIAAREIGLPLFKALSAEVGKWNKWLEDHPKEIQNFIKGFSQALIDGFETIKQIVSFIIDNKGVIMAVGGAFMAKSMFGGMGGMGAGLTAAAGGGGPFGPLLSNFTLMGETAGGLVTKLATFGSQLSVAAGALGALYLVLQGIADWAGKEHRKSLNFEEQYRAGNKYVSNGSKFEALIAGRQEAMRQGDSKVIAQANNELMPQVHQMIEFARELGAYNDEKGLDVEALKNNKVSGGGAYRREFIQLFTEAADLWSQMNPKTHDYSKDVTENSARTNTGGKANMNVTIGRIEVASDDPDRFVVGMGRAFEQMRRNKTQAHGSLGAFGGQ